MAALRAGALALLLLSCASAGEPAGLALDVFPRADEVFHRLLADPRQTQTSARYYRLGGRDMGDVALGNMWGLLRWTPEGADWRAQWNIEGMAYSRFHVTGGINEFETVDFFLNLPVEARRGRLSGRAMLYHESSHLGDDYIRRTGDQGFRYSVEGLKLAGSWDAHRFLRLYGGPSFLVHAVPRQRSATLQWGFELRSPDFLRKEPFYAYLAQDFQSKSQVGWNVDSNTQLGVRMAFRRAIRSLRVHLDYFDGHSPFGQYFRRREHYLSLGLSFDF